MQTCDEKLSIGGLKRQLSELERVDEDLIVLVHSGEELKDDAVPVLCGMDRFNGNGEIFLDLQVLKLLYLRTCELTAIYMTEHGSR